MESISNVLDTMEKIDKMTRIKKSLNDAYLPCGAVFILAACTGNSEALNVVGYGVAIAIIICVTLAERYSTKIKELEKMLPTQINGLIFPDDSNATEMHTGQIAS